MIGQTNHPLSIKERGVTFLMREKKTSRNKKWSPLRFHEMATIINRYLVEDQQGILLNFEGYKDMLSRYLRLQEQDQSEVFAVITEANLWSEYFSQLIGLIYYRWLHAKMEVDYMTAMIDKKNPNEERQNLLARLTKKEKDLGLFYQQLLAQQKFCEKAFWHGYQLMGSIYRSFRTTSD